MGCIKMSFDIYMDVSYHLKSQATIRFRRAEFPRLSGPADVASRIETV